MPTIYTKNFQTPMPVADYMAGLVPASCQTILEPTPGIGNIVRALERQGKTVTAPGNYFDLPKDEAYDAVVMNPPFSYKYVDDPPASFNQVGIKAGYWFLSSCMARTDNVIALMPWATLADSDRRLRSVKQYGLISVTALPRRTFEYARVQTCVLQLKKGYQGKTELRVFGMLQDVQLPMF